MRPARPLLALVLAALLALVVGCGGGDAETTTAAAGAAATTPPAATAGTGTGGDIVCGDDEPAASGERPTYTAPPPMTITPARSYTATLSTSCGDIVIALDPEAAPMTVNNFITLARDGFYDGLTFHRTVPGFVIQGGDPAGDGTGGPGYTFADELPTGDAAYPAGSVAMANSGPDTNGSQFFIVTGQAPLPPQYSRFGEVTRGLDVARAIEALGDASTQAPSTPVYINRVTISES
jgi:cyclophilin family peptidyl-prolyl cis-trans isomerase